MYWLMALTATALIAVALPLPESTIVVTGFVSLHTALEVVAIAIAFMAFGVTWAAQRFRRDGRAMLLGSAFLTVGLMDLARALSLDGMPAFITPNSENKSVLFWLAARVTAAAALLLAAYLPLRRELALKAIPRRTWLMGSLMVSSLAVYGVVFHQPSLPAVFDPERGTTPFKTGMEVLLVCCFAATAVGLWKRPQADGGLGYRPLAIAAAAMAISGAFVATYVTSQGPYSMVALGFKILGYLFLFRGVFVAIIEEPIVQLAYARSQQQATLDALPDVLSEVDRHGTYLAVYAHEPQYLSHPAHELVGKGISEVLPPPAADTCRAAIDEAAQLGISRGKRFSLRLPGGLAHFELSVAKRKVPAGQPITYLMLSRDVSKAVAGERILEREAHLNVAIVALQQLSLTASEKALLQRGLALAEELTSSVISFVHFVNEDQNTIELITWSERTLETYCRAAFDRHYPADQAGIWAEALRTKTAMVFNDYASATGRKGLPAGHAHLQRLISLPVVRAGRVVMLLGVGNKSEDYDQADVDVLQRLAEALWQVALQDRQLEKIRQLSTALDQSPYPAVITDTEARIEYVNAAFTTVSGYGASEVLGRNPKLLQSGETPTESYRDLWTHLLNGEAWQGQFINRRKDGRRYVESAVIYPVRNAQGDVTHYVAHKEDITTKLEAQNRIQALTEFDPLTGLANRQRFDQRLAELLSEATAKQHKILVACLNLDNFKAINEVLGHAAGDELLVMVAKRLKTSLGDNDLLTRFSGDTFIAAIPFTNQATAVVTTKTAVSRIPEALSLRGTTVSLSASAGVAIFPDDAKDVTELCAAAEVAMYRVKSDGRNGLRFYSSQMQENSRRSLELSASIGSAIQKGNLRLMYQPQQCLKTGRLVGAEALARWQHSELGAVSPAEFIPLAEQNGAINAIGRWVLQQAVAQVSSWQSSGLTSLVMAVNVSAVQFGRPDWLHELLSIVHQAGIPPASIEIELTEAVALRDPEGAVRTIEKLHEAGFRIALDDFGTGFSSLSYLRRYAIDKLKIDQSFIRGIESSPPNREIVTAVIRMAHGMGITVLAEGAEDPSGIDFLAAQGCDEIQGHGYSKPLEPDDFLRFARQSITG